MATPRSHGLTRKGKPEDESLHVPLIVRWPDRIAAGAQIDTLSTSIDLMPTLISLAGLKIPGHCEGRDHASALLSGSEEQVDSLFTQGQMTNAQKPVARSGHAHSQACRLRQRREHQAVRSRA